MQFLASLSVLQASVLGIALGFCLALSVKKQLQIQNRDIEIDRAGGKTSLFERLSYAGLSLALALLAVVLSTQVTALARYDFLLVFLSGAFATWLGAYLIRLWHYKKK